MSTFLARTARAPPPPICSAGCLTHSIGPASSPSSSPSSWALPTSRRFWSGSWSLASPTHPPFPLPSTGPGLARRTGLLIAAAAKRKEAVGQEGAGGTRKEKSAASARKKATSKGSSSSKDGNRDTFGAAGIFNIFDDSSGHSAAGYYAVATGRQPGVYHTWGEAECQVKGFGGALFRKFSTEREALQYVATGGEQQQPLQLQEDEEAAAASRRRAAAAAGAAAGAAAAGAAGVQDAAGVWWAAGEAGPYYAVAKGVKVGLFRSWDEARTAVEGVPTAVHKRFSSLQEAEAFLALHGVRRGPTAPASSASTAPSAAAAAAAAVSATPPTAAAAAAAAVGTADGRVKCYYGVGKGWQTGVFSSWGEASVAVAGFSGAVYKKFKTEREARAFVAALTWREQQRQQQRQQEERKQEGAGQQQERKQEGAEQSAEQGVVEVSHAAAAVVGSETAAVEEEEKEEQAKEEEEEQEEAPAGKRSKRTSTAEQQETQRDGGRKKAQKEQQLQPKASKAEVARRARQQQLEDTALTELLRLSSTTSASSSSSRASSSSSSSSSSTPPPPLYFESLGAAIQPDQMYRLEFDGGSRGNPGRAGFGAALIEEGSERHVEYVAGPLQGTTNNVAEWSALAAGLQMAQELGVRHLSVQGDSELVCRQVMGVYAVNTPGLQPLAARVMPLRAGFESFAVKHVPRSQNGLADLLSNLAMDAEQAVEELGAAGGAASRLQRQELLQLLGEPAVRAAHAALEAAAVAPRYSYTLRTTAEALRVEACAPVLATRGSQAGGDVAGFNRALIALAAASRRWLD